MPRSAVDPPAFLRLAGHPLRWRLLGELSRSDRTVRELTDRTGHPQNLVSYHLGKLRDGRLVEARRSSADRRDTYYTAELTRLGDLLSATGAALHPGLRLAPAEPVGDAAAGTRVLFLCTGNSARSQMAEALVRERSHGAVEAASAGSDPRPVHPHAVRALREVHGLDMADQQPKHVDVYAGERFDRVVSLCDRVREACPPFVGRPVTAHWSIPNPADDGARYPAFRRVATELDTRIGFLLASLAS